MAKGEARRPQPRPQAPTPGHWRRPWTLPPSLLASNSLDDEGGLGIQLWPHKAYLKENPQRNLTVLVYVNADLSTSKLLVMLYDCVSVRYHCFPCFISVSDLFTILFNNTNVSLIENLRTLFTSMYVWKKIIKIYTRNRQAFIAIRE